MSDLIRVKGSVAFPTNFEVTAGAPMDARLVVENEAALTNADAYTAAIYAGMVVFAKEERTLWVYTGESMPGESQKSENWLKLASGGSSFDGVDSNDKILIFEGNKLKSNLSFSYNSVSKELILAGIDGVEIGKVDASDFIKDGMLNTAEYDPNTHSIVFTFNTDSGKESISIDVTEFVQTYTAGNGISIDSSNVISISTSNVSSDVATVETGSINVDFDNVSGAVNLQVNELWLEDVISKKSPAPEAGDNISVNSANGKSTISLDTTNLVGDGLEVVTESDHSKIKVDETWFRAQFNDNQFVKEVGSPIGINFDSVAYECGIYTVKSTLTFTSDSVNNCYLATKNVVDADGRTIKDICIDGVYDSDGNYIEVSIKRSGTSIQVRSNSSISGAYLIYSYSVSAPTA